MINFTNQNVTCIQGYKLDGCKEPLEGWKVFIDLNRDGILDPGESSDTTDSAGHWLICGLDAGSTVRVAEQLKAGWKASQPSTGWQDITVQPNNGSGYINLTNQKLLCISGYKLDNCNKAAQPGWKITLTNGTYTANKTTDSNGWYQFCGLAPGNYSLKETVKPGWIQVAAPPDVTLDCDNITNQNFTNTRKLCISGYKLDECSKAALPGWKITLTNGTYTANKTTDSNGWYQFCGLAPGKLQPEGDRQTRLDSGRGSA